MISKDFINEINTIKKNLSLISVDFKIIHSNDCSIYWNGKIKKYIVNINRNQIDYFLIHEFGHVLLSKIVQYPYFAKLPSEIEKVNQNIINYFNNNPMAELEDLPKELRDFKIIQEYSNGILDSFVNYQTFINNMTYYNLYENYIEEILNSTKNGFRPGRLRILLPSYINFYLEFNYHIRERYQNKKDLDNFLHGLKNIILNSKNYDLGHFNLLNECLDNYIEIRDTIDFKTIIDFIQTILLNLSLWENNIVKEKLKILYPI